MWKIVKSVIGFKTMQLHLLFNIYLWKNHERKKLSGITRCPKLPGLPLTSLELNPTIHLLHGHIKQNKTKQNKKKRMYKLNIL